MLVAIAILLCILLCALIATYEEELREIYHLAEELVDSFFDDEEEE